MNINEKVKSLIENADIITISSGKTYKDKILYSVEFSVDKKDCTSMNEEFETSICDKCGAPILNRKCSYCF